MANQSAAASKLSISMAHVPDQAWHRPTPGSSAATAGSRMALSLRCQPATVGDLRPGAMGHSAHPCAAYSPNSCISATRFVVLIVGAALARLADRGLVNFSVGCVRQVDRREGVSFAVSRFEMPQVLDRCFRSPRERSDLFWRRFRYPAGQA